MRPPVFYSIIIKLNPIDYRGGCYMMFVYEMMWISFGLCLLGYGIYKFIRNIRDKKASN
jgi:hypothetical protein